MEEEIAKLRQQLQEEQRRRQEAELRREEEPRRREEAEALAESSRFQTIGDYLQACHSLSLAIQVIKDRSLTTQGDITKPEGRLFPRRIIPWDSFPVQQERIWARISTSSDFPSQRIFPSLHQLEYVRSVIFPISDEIGLRDYEHDTVENAVQKLMSAVHGDEYLRNEFRLRGTVTFEGHTNLGQANDTVEETLIGEDRRDETGTKRSRKDNQQRPKIRRKARGKGNRADEFCVYRTFDGEKSAAVAIEYKAPHELTRDEIVAGLESEIRPERDVINKEGSGFAFASRSLAAAVITQLFSYMIGKGIQYGYVCTGEAFVFLHIPDDPNIVYYYVSVPNLDFQEDDETRIHRTAVAQVFAFVLHALLAEPPDQSWHDKTETLDMWEVEYIDILKNIPETVRKEHPPTPYKPSRWRGFQRSPIRPGTDGMRDDEDEGDSASPSPSTNRTRRPHGRLPPSASSTDAKTKRTRGVKAGQQSRLSIKDRPFCSQRCLLGLAHGGAMDNDCPNFLDHGKQHIRREDFLRLTRVQLAQDRGPDADCRPLYLSGARGSLFKVRLSSHGYTLVAKGVEHCDRRLLERENELYHRLRAIQGTHIPACLGTTDLDLPYYYDCGVYVRFLFLGWAGRPLLHCITKDNAAHLQDQAARAFTALHQLHVLHHDAEPRNLAYDEQKDSLMIVDFERAEFHDRHALQSINLNQTGGKRKREKPVVLNVEKRGTEEFERELRLVIACFTRLARSLSR